METEKDNVIHEQISRFQKIKLYFFCVVYATRFLLRKAIKRLFKTKIKSYIVCDKPQSCLVDNTLGFHSYVKVKRTKIHYVEAGNKDSPIILLLHGFPDCWLGWRHQIKFLSEHYRVIAVDLKGFGDSDKPVSRSSYTIKILVGELMGIIGSFHNNTFAGIIGHDLGGYIGWYMATLNPTIIKKFVAISCPHPNVFWDYMPNSSRLSSRWIQFCQIPFLPELEAGENNLAIIDDFYSHLKIKKEEKLIAAYKYVFSRPEDWTGPINYYRNLPYYRIESGRTKVSVPTLLITGNRDPIVPLESILTSAEFISSVYSIKIVKNTGHFPHQESPDFVNDLLLQFLTVPKKKVEPINYRKRLIDSFYDTTMKYKIPW